MYRTALAALLTVMLVAVGFAVAVPTASAQCGGKGEPPCPPPPPPACDPEKNECVICHNIGGPRDLGANCDMTGTCEFTTDTGTITVTPPNFLGIIISFNQDSEGALNAHINHGDGFIITTFDPPLHLASDGQNHQAANVECLAARIVQQPDEPGN